MVPYLASYCCKSSNVCCGIIMQKHLVFSHLHFRILQVNYLLERQTSTSTYLFLFSSTLMNIFMVHNALLVRKECSPFQATLRELRGSSVRKVTVIYRIHFRDHTKSSVLPTKMTSRRSLHYWLSSLASFSNHLLPSFPYWHHRPCLPLPSLMSSHIVPYHQSVSPVISRTQYNPLRIKPLSLAHHLDYEQDVHLVH